MLARRKRRCKVRIRIRRRGPRRRRGMGSRLRPNRCVLQAGPRRISPAILGHVLRDLIREIRVGGRRHALTLAIRDHLRVLIRGSPLLASPIPENQTLDDRRRDDLILGGRIQGVRQMRDRVRLTISGREITIACGGTTVGGLATSIAVGDLYL
jgi:hypothetical protein